jgi:two-component system sensor histidine kinase RegB
MKAWGLASSSPRRLLERSGAELSFANGTDPFLPPEDRPTAAARWSRRSGMRADLQAPRPRGLGANPAIES